MIEFFETYKHLVDQVIINCILALSQYLVFRAGVFSIATAGFAAIGAYSAAIATTQFNIHPLLGGCIALILDRIKKS